jgi:hypothetical protein
MDSDFPKPQGCLPGKLLGNRNDVFPIGNNLSLGQSGADRWVCNPTILLPLPWPEPALARADGGLRHLLARLSRTEVLVIDDCAVAPLNESEAPRGLEICEDRIQTRSTVLTSQLPGNEQIGDPTIADGILDRLVHNAHHIEMRGESMRKNRSPSRDPSQE